MYKMSFPRTVCAQYQIMDQLSIECTLMLSMPARRGGRSPGCVTITSHTNPVPLCRGPGEPSFLQEWDQSPALVQRASSRRMCTEHLLTPDLNSGYSRME